MRGGTHLYIIQSSCTGAVKVGRSQDAEARLAQLQTGSAYRLRLLAVFHNEGHNERWFHNLLARYKLNLRGEWFHHGCLSELPDPYYSALPFDDRWWVESGSPLKGS